ncbi:MULTISPECIES: hypothetical protein [unclassified Mycobacterium]|uniref:hypothetical protein n=1 Tax=unclassified Mycobacterium TaxID=2642494 RepID=UPI000A580685|nr:MULTISPECIES: hypothetical protein [unclassified Mycobacterium]
MTVVLIATVAGNVATPPVSASVNPALNGTYIATSDGFWAKSNETRRAEATVVSTWTIASSCTGAYDCTGTVTSDHGWSAEIVYISRMWFVTRVLDNWVRCPDGTTPPGKQIFKFYEDPNSSGKYVGWDTATGPSGACGVNRPLFIEMPFTLVPN